MSGQEGLALERLVLAGERPSVLDEVSLVVPSGSMLSIVGDAGSGKSTVLATIAGQRAPGRGRVLLDGRPVHRSSVGFAEQQHDLPDGLTAAEHLAVPMLARGRRPGGWDAIEARLAALGLPPSSFHNRLEELSGGQQQRVAIARALVGDPPLVCLDDPTSELDGSTADRVWAELDRAARGGAVIVVATPRADESARSDLVIRLDPPQ